MNSTTREPAEILIVDDDSLTLAGATEASLIADKIPYVAGKAFYANNARGQIVIDWL